MKISRLLGATALAGSLLLSPAAAWAQDDAQGTVVQDPDAPAADDDTGVAITVTGSRIARPTLESSVPVTSMTVDELTNTGDVTLGDALNDLPSLRSTFSTQNSGRFIGTAGLSVLDLRGLGTARTLVLVNGRRHVTASPGDYLVDVNTIPVDLLERIDIVTGGNSAIYGSDAVAGVVNFVLKRDFDGTKIRAQGGISERGDRGSYFVSATVGTNFADGRGNIALSGEFAAQQPLYFRGRDDQFGAYSGRCQFNTAEPQGAAGGEVGPSASDGVPDTQFFCGIKNAGISVGGTIGTLTVGGVAGAQALRFAPDGTLFLDTPTRTFVPFGSAQYQGGQGTTLREVGQLSVGLQRWTSNLLAHYDFSDAFKPFIEAKYVHVDAIQEGQASFWQGSLASFLGVPSLRCNNPFLRPEALATLQSYGICTNVAAGTFNTSRFNADWGGRGEVHDRDTYRFVGGVEGDFNDDWHYELAVNWGRLETFYTAKNNLLLADQAGNLAGFGYAVDAVLAPAGYSGDNFALNYAGQKVICRVNLASNVIPGCVPVNSFGANQADPRGLAFSHASSYREEWAEELVLSGFVRGDLSQLFELPGGPIQFALGAEYRSEKAYSDFDDLTQSGGTFLNSIATFAPPKFAVKEAYGEVRIPLLKDMPGFEILAIEGAGRVSDYNSAVGTVYAYNISGIWAPIRDIRFRANYSTSVRAPTQSDLYSTASQNFSQLTDPCDALQITNGSRRAANCAAMGVPTTVSAALVTACDGTGFTIKVGDPFINCTARVRSTGFLSGGNPTLVEEKGKSLTLGAILTPRFIPGLSLTVDYYDIEVTNLISGLGAQTILNLCYDSPTGINNSFCAAINPRESTGLFTNRALFSGGINFAKQETSGVDFDLAYNHRFANGDRVTVRAIATYLKTLTNYLDPTDPTFGNRQKSEIGDPEWAANASITYDFGTFNVQYSVQYLDPMTIGAYEAQNSFQGRPPTNADQYPFIWYPEKWYHNLRFGVDIDDFEFYLGIDNVTNELPPWGVDGTGSTGFSTSGGAIYGNVGRFFYAGVNVDF